MKNTEYRKPTDKEVKIINLFLDNEFIGRDEIASQTQDFFVKTLDKDGSIGFSFDKSKYTKAPTTERVPIEAKLETNDFPIYFLLHVLDGYLLELETYKADSSGENLINNLKEADFDQIKFYI